MYEKFVEVNVLHLFQAAYLLLLNYMLMKKNVLCSACPVHGQVSA